LLHKWSVGRGGGGGLENAQDAFALADESNVSTIACDGGGLGVY